jgi:iron complex outermembrane receptor protein
MQYAVSARVGVLHAAIVSALSGAFSSQAIAQDEEDDEGVVETVVVTARFREESIQQTPIAITAVTNTDIEVRGITEAYEIANLVPNASLRPAQAAFGNTMTAFIRGIGQNDFDFAFEPGVGIYIDDVYHPFTLGSQMDLLDLERVEVLRGPQGTLFGRGSIGGAMRYITAKPQGDNTGTVQVTAGD